MKFRDLVTMVWRDKKHPAWSLAKIMVLIGGLTLMMHVNAQHFDSGEVKTVIGATLLSVFLEALGIKKANT